MTKRNLDGKYLNKIFNIKIVGKGERGNFLGKVGKIVCFIDQKDKEVNFGDEVTVKIIHTSKSCLFSEII